MVKTLEQAVRSAIKEEIGDDENITFPRKHIIRQKYGEIPTVITQNDLFWIERYDDAL
jgi:hypothetical protein